MEMLPNPPREVPSKVVSIRLVQLAAKRGVTVEELKRQITEEVDGLVAAKKPLHVVKKQK